MTTFRWAATAQAASVVVGEMVCAASCASPASRRPRDGVENRHFFAPRHRRNGPQDRRKLKGKVRISLLWRFRRPQGTYWRQHRPCLKYIFATWNAVQCFAFLSVSKAACFIKKSLRKSPSLRPPLDRGFTARHPCVSPSQASPRVSRRFRVAERVQDSIWPGPSHVRDRAC